MDMNLKKENKLFCESEITIMEKGTPRFKKIKDLTFGDYLRVYIGNEHIGEIKNLKVVADKLSIITDENKIFKYELLSDVLTKPLFVKNTKVKNRNVTLVLTYIPAEAKMFETLTVSLTVVGETDSVVYVNITYSEQVNKLNHKFDIGDNRAYRTRRLKSLVAFDKNGAAPKAAEFLIKSAINKINENRKDELIELQRYMLKCYCIDIDDNFNQGKNFYDEERYVEALPYLLSVHRKMQSNFLNFEEEENSVFQDVLYMIGDCYLKIGEYEKAFYYLSFANSKNAVDIERYKMKTIECLSKKGDIRAVLASNNK